MNFFHFFSQNISCYAIEGIPFPNSLSLLYIFKKSFLFIRCYGCTLPKNPPKGRWDCDVLKNGNTVCMLQCEVSSNTMETELRMNKLKTPVPIIAGLCVYLYCKIYHTVNRLRSFLSSCHPVIMLSSHLVIQSSGNPVILSSGHPVILSCCHLDVWSCCHQVIWSGHLFI